jgi:hypothetical protein
MRKRERNNPRVGKGGMRGYDDEWKLEEGLK